MKQFLSINDVENLENLIQDALEYKMLTGNASTPNTLRVLPALNVKKEDVKKFADALIQILNEY